MILEETILCFLCFLCFGWMFTIFEAFSWIRVRITFLLKVFWILYNFTIVNLHFSWFRGLKFNIFYILNTVSINFGPSTPSIFVKRPLNPWQIIFLSIFSLHPQRNRPFYHWFIAKISFRSSFVCIGCWAWSILLMIYAKMSRFTCWRLLVLKIVRLSTFLWILFQSHGIL